MKYWRYEAVSPRGKSVGVFSAPFDMCDPKVNKALGLSDEEVYDLYLSNQRWLHNPKIDGLYFFKEKGKRLFEENTLPLMQTLLLEGWMIICVEIEAKDSPLYEDDYQACF